MTEHKKSNELKRGLSNRHIQLIAFGGAIGTGLFLGVGISTVLAGPSVILDYLIGGIIAFFIMRQLGEMIVEEPEAGSFSFFANKYWCRFAGFTSGWNYWMLYSLVSMTELTAVGTYIHFWWPEIPLWSSSLFFFIVINALNLTNVRVYGEIEFWFSIIKILAIILMIIFGAFLLFSGLGGENASINNLFNHGGFFPKGIFKLNDSGSYQGFLSVIAIVMFSFGGVELIGMTAAETSNPRKVIPKATNQIIYRILIFYVGALIILFSLSPWTEIKEHTSPFVLVFEKLNTFEFSLFGQTIYVSKLIANILNIVVLSAALSVYNSSVYANSRMLFGLAKQNNAPRIFMKLNKNQVPIIGILVSACFAFLCVLINYLTPEKALTYFIALSVSALIINWGLISIIHIFFKRNRYNKSKKTYFPSIFYPISNYICLLFLVGIIAIMWLTGMKLSIIIIPVWIVVLYCGFKIKNNIN